MNACSVVHVSGYTLENHCPYLCLSHWTQSSARHPCISDCAHAIEHLGKLYCRCNNLFAPVWVYMRLLGCIDHIRWVSCSLGCGGRVWRGLRAVAFCSPIPPWPHSSLFLGLTQIKGLGAPVSVRPSIQDKARTSLVSHLMIKVQISVSHFGQEYQYFGV